MSRRVLPSHAYEIFIGWDRPLQTYFLTVNDPSCGDPVVYIPEMALPHELTHIEDPEDLIEKAKEYADPFDAETLRDQLLSDRETNNMATYR